SEPIAMMTTVHAQPASSAHAGGLATPPSISVIIPVFNDAGNLRKSLASLRNGDVSAEIIVVDDASTDGSDRVAEELGARVVRMERNSGPAEARNRGASVAAGQVLLFIDADVCAHPDTLGRILQSVSDADAVFGSYDLAPAATNALSQYKNLFHHFMHQQGPGEAATFWSGCGAIRRSVFWEAGGFDPTYIRSCIEDIELGMRLRRSGRRIVINKQVQVTHLKKWTLWGLIKSDFRDRAVPWTVLILRQRHLPRAPTLALSQRVSVLFTALTLLVLLAGAVQFPLLALAAPATVLAILAIDWISGFTRSLLVPNLVSIASAGAALAGMMLYSGIWGVAVLALLGCIVGLNWRLYWFLARARGLGFAVFVIPLQLLYFVYSGVALAWGTILHVRDGLLGPQRSARAAEAP
ncbi:MAG: glycosyltransferase family 2 protein, partial [Tepidisphaeraceae bacterium]